MTQLKKKNKKYKSNKLIIVLSIVFAAMLFGIAFLAYLYVSQNFQSVSVSTGDTAVTETADDTVAGVYTPYKAIESETEKDTPLAAVFGSSYSQYGGELILFEDGTFTLYIGVSNNEDSTGTYNEENGVISAVYESGKTAEFQVSADENGKKIIIVPMGLYNIYFH